MSNLQVHQLNKLKEIFDRFDMDSDESLSMWELAAFLRYLGLKPSGDQVKNLLANVDSNGNRKVEFEELVRVIFPDINPQVLANLEQLLQLFNGFDRDRNGFISKPELARGLTKLGKQMGKHVSYHQFSDIIRVADTDGDGDISFTEFVSLLADSASELLGFSLF